MKKLLFLSLMLGLALQSEAGVTAQALKLRGGTLVGPVNWNGVSYFGFAFQSMTTAERNALTPTYAGTTIYNSDSANTETWNGGSWIENGGGGSGSGSFSVKESDVSVGSGITTLDFGNGFDVTISPAGEVNIVPDYTELPGNSAAFSNLTLGNSTLLQGQLLMYSGSNAFRTNVKSLIQTANRDLWLPIQTGTDTVATQSWVRANSVVGASDTLHGTLQEIFVSGGANSVLQDVTLSLSATVNLNDHTAFLVPSAATPTVNSGGAIGFDTDRYGASRGAYLHYDGSGRTFSVDIQNSETPADGDYPRYNSTGTWTSDPGVSINVGLNQIPWYSTANTRHSGAMSWDSVVTHQRTYNQKGAWFASGTPQDSLKLNTYRQLYFLDYENNNSPVFRVDTVGNITSPQLSNASGAVQIGKASTTSISLVTDGPGGPGEVVLPDSSINRAEIASGAITEDNFAFSNNTTRDASTSKHGLMPKYDGTATHFLDMSGTQRALAETDMPLGTVSTVKFRTSDTLTAAAAFTNVGGMYFTPVNGAYYEFQFTIIFRDSSTTSNGIKVGLTCGANTYLAADVQMHQGADGNNGDRQGTITASGDGVSSTTVEAVSTNYVCTIHGIFLPTSTTNLQLQFGSPDNTNFVYIKRGSLLRYWRYN